VLAPRNVFPEGGSTVLEPVAEEDAIDGHAETAEENGGGEPVGRSAS
jgi:hypothetical protein